MKSDKMQIAGQPIQVEEKDHLTHYRHPIRATAKVMDLAQAWVSFVLSPHTLTAALDLIPLN